jgi:hypothetical protein
MEATDELIVHLEEFAAADAEQRRLGRLCPSLLRPVAVVRWAAAWALWSMAWLGCAIGLNPGESRLLANLWAAADWAQGDGPGPTPTPSTKPA